MNWCDDDFSSQDRDMIYLDAAGKSPLPKIVAATGYEALQTKVVMIFLTYSDDDTFHSANLGLNRLTQHKMKVGDFLQN